MVIDPINWRMVSHPINWVTIVLMLVIAGAIGHYALSLAGFEPTTKDGQTATPSTGLIPVN